MRLPGKISAMSYRRPDDKGIFSSRWRIAHLSQLSECGIPADISSDDRRWTHALLHGYDPESGWETSWLSDEQANRLRELLTPHFPNPIGVGLVKDLLSRT